MNRRRGRPVSSRSRPIVWALAILATACAVPSARAQISFVNMFREGQYQQTSNSAPTTLTGYFIGASLNSVNPGAYDSAQLTYPGPGSPQDLPLESLTSFSFGSGLFASQAALDAAYGTGIYTYSGTNASTTDSTTIDYETNLYPQSLPFLTGTNFTDLQGMDPTKAFTFNFSPFLTGAGATESLIFFTVHDKTTNTDVVIDGLLPSTTPGVTVAANTFVAGHSYTYDLDYSNRIVFPTDGSSEFGNQVGYDLRVEANFTPAAVPEPGSMTLLAPAALLLGWRIRRRRVR